MITGTKFIYEVRYARPGAGKPGHFDAHESRAEADADAKRMNERAARIRLEAVYTVHEVDVTGAFEFPPKPRPRERFSQRWTEVPTRPGCWNATSVEILEGERIAGTYQRNYPGRPPFEPFRQGGRDYALISARYTATAVMDLASGEIVADEKKNEWGFCPVGFYVPDWWDVHDGSILPGSRLWEDADEWPDGSIGFVWGCVWGDDNGWKVQALDLSGVAKGKLSRDERFGYVYLDTSSKLEPQDFIRCRPGEGGTGPRVTFSVPKLYDLTSGKALD